MFEGLPADEAWRLLYDVACTCSPAAMRGLCALARGLEGWPPAWNDAPPTPYAIFCHMCPPAPPSTHAADEPAAYAPCELAPAPRAGRVVRAPRA